MTPAIGYRSIPPRDPKEAVLRAACHDTRDRHGAASPEHAVATNRLSEYLWNRTKAEIEADRQKHPKAKRNAPVGSATIGERTGKAEVPTIDGYTKE